MTIPNHTILAYFKRCKINHVTFSHTNEAHPQMNFSHFKIHLLLSSSSLQATTPAASTATTTATTPTTMYVHIHLPRFVSLGLRRLTIYLAITTTPPPHHHNVCASFQSLLLIHFNLRTTNNPLGAAATTPTTRPMLPTDPITSPRFRYDIPPDLPAFVRMLTSP